MERRFHCTACGKCCYGWLPLTLADARTHAGRFPLALVWTLAPQGSKAFPLISRLGATAKLDRKQTALLIVPTAYIPPSFPCPALAPDGLCTIHADKPSRCRTMPFYPYRNEEDQADLLVPRKGWACDTSATAPVVYRNKKIVDRADFDRERGELLEQAPSMRTYAEYMLKYQHWVIDSLAKAGPGGNVVTGLSSFLTATKLPDAATLAARQLPVLADYAARTAGEPKLVEYARNYAGWAKEMDYLARRG
jgi:Fe-S-cluster containining protein